MTDDPLAHLYAETGAGVDEELESPVRHRPATLEELTRDVDDEEELSEHDRDELVGMIAARIRSTGPVPVGELVELGLVFETDGGYGLTKAGRAVFDEISRRARILLGAMEPIRREMDRILEELRR